MKRLEEKERRPFQGGILSKEAIIAEIASGTIAISPYDPSHIGPTNYDLTLAPTFRRYKDSCNKIIVSEGLNYLDYTEKIELAPNEVIPIHPGETILGITKEQITLPTHICGFFYSRSSYARMGLFSQIAAPFIHPGASLKIVQEIHNASPYTLALKPGTKTAQIVFSYVVGEGRYQGRFINQGL